MTDHTDTTNATEGPPTRKRSVTPTAQREISRHDFFKMGMLGVASMAGLGELASAAPAWASARGAGDLIICVPAEPIALNQDVDNNSASTAIREICVEYLVTPSPANHLPSQTGLLTGWQQIDDLTWHFTARQTQFSNGEPFDARAAAWNLGHAVAAKAGFTGAYIGLIQSAHHIGLKTLVVKTSQPVPYLPAVLSLVQALPPAYYTKMGSVPFSHAPIGTGPFIFQEWVPGDHILFTANPKYYGSVPKLNSVKYIFASQSSTRLNLLATGAAHIINNLAPTDTAPSPNTTVKQQLSELNIVLEFNMHQPPFDDVRLRHAVALGIDRNTLVKAVFGAGGASPYSNVYNPMFPAAKLPKKDYITFNFDAAKAMLASVGNVPTINFIWPVGRYTSDNLVGPAITGMLQDIGFKVNQQPLTSSAYSTALNSNQMNGVHLLGGAVAFADVAGTLASKYLQNSVITYAADPDIWDLAAKGATMRESPARDDLYRQIEEIILYKNFNPVPLYLQHDVYGIANSVQGFTTVSNPGMVWSLLNQVSLKT
jgi:peptide/nickel transport system substrate-binding protein